MRKYLLIAEKPSLMRDIQACYKKHIDEINKKVGVVDFIALSGHVCRYCNPDEYDEWADEKWSDIDYPMIPRTWPVRPIDDEKKMQLLKQISDTQNNYDGFIVATDSDVEGYGIYHLMEQYLGIQKKPALRFIEHSLTDKEILASLLSMTDYHKDISHIRNTYSYVIRARADWLFGMNSTRIMTNKIGTIMRIGRVKAPTIKLVYDNSMAISGFKKEKYYNVIADYGNFKSTLSDEKDEAVKFRNIKNIGTYPLKGVVTDIQTETEYTHAPKLFDLTNLQSEAGRAFGFTPAHTLEVVQSLYETHKVISYPRTQCRYVSSEKAREFVPMLRHMSAYPDLAKALGEVTKNRILEVYNDKSVVNDDEVSKESHDALLPTSTRVDPSQLTDDENKICHMIYARLLSQFMPKASDKKTKVSIRHGDDIFIAKGKTVVEQGWRKLLSEGKSVYIPTLEKGQIVTADKIGPEEKTTKPPKRLTQATLINAMQNIASLIDDKKLRKSLADSKGIGTPATRANIISEIIQTGYVQDKKEGLYITQLGKTYIESLNGIDIISPEFAAVMDTDIKRVQRGEADYKEVYKKVINELYSLCGKMEALPQSDKAKSRVSRTLDLQCPICGEKIMERQYSYSCSSKNCDFKVSRNICGAEITEDILKTLLDGEKTKPMDLKSKAGKTFSARLALVNNKVEFDFNSGIQCPKCGAENMRVNNGGAFCDCGLKVFRKQFGTVLTDNDLEDLLENGKTEPIELYNEASGSNYSIRVNLNDDWTTSRTFE